MPLLTSFRSLTFATALWAFLALVSSGQIHWWAAAGFVVFFVLACFRERLAIELPAFAWTFISLVAFAIAMWGWFQLGERMYSATYFFFYLEINKLLTARANRDYLQVYALTFFHVLAGAVSTESAAFAPMLAVYVLLVVASMMAFTLKRDAEAAFEVGRRRKKGPAPDPDAPRRVLDGDRAALSAVGAMPFLTRSFSTRLSGAALFVLVLGAGIFWIVPRTSKQSFFSPFGGETRAPRRSGFAEHIEFGGVGEIQTDPSIIMRAMPELPPGRERPESLRIRGTALDEFTGRSWRKSQELFVRRSVNVTSERVDFEPAGILQRDPSRAMRVRMIAEPDSSNYMFLPNQPGTLLLPRTQPLNVDPVAWSVQRNDGNFEPMSYEVVALLPREDARAAGGSVRSQAGVAGGFASALRRLAADTVRDARGAIRRPGTTVSGDAGSPVHLSVPPFPGRETVQRLAREWTQGVSGPVEIARAIERRFKTEFSYSLSNDFSDREDHLAWFLTESRTGHCEYFATAMALMLRESGVPSRVVNGYFTDEWSATGDRFIVRQEHAHSWVEAMVDGSGEWTTYDPTPDAGIGSNRTGASFYHFFSRAGDLLKMVWYQSVIDYNQTDQQVGFRMLLRWARRLSERTQTGMEAMGDARSGREGLVSATALPLAAGAAGLCTIAVAAVLWARQRRRIHAIRTAGSAARTSRSDLVPYLELLREAQQAFPRAAAQTPLAWASDAAVRAGGALDDLVPVTAAYYRARYEDTPLGDEWRPRIAALRRSMAQIAAGNPQGTPSAPEPA